MVPECNQQPNNEPSEEQRFRAQRMEAVGYLAGGVAHDFNNLLGVILGYCEILQQQDLLSELARSMVAEIHHAGASAKKLTHGLLAFTRRHVLPPVALDLNQSVREMQPMLARMIGDDIQLVTMLANGLGTIEADPGQLEQVLMNLAINARDAMPKGGKICIETANLDIASNAVGVNPAAQGPDTQETTDQADRYVTLTVTDEGVGMDESTQTHMFEPFFSTKLPAGSTGLGLSTVRGIVHQSRGAIRVHSSPGRGTRFDIRFPRYDATPIALQKRAIVPISGGTETILLVDDALALRVLTRRILEDCGYRVFDTGDPLAALQIAADHPAPIHLLITDMNMPGLSGFDLAEKLAVARPGMPVLFASGYGTTWTTRRDDLAMLEKPFSREDLLTTVRALLDRHWVNGTRLAPPPAPPAFHAAETTAKSASTAAARPRTRSA